MINKGLSFLALSTFLLAFTVILLGAYTRLSDAGLGCPDWPGCYGRFSAPHTQGEITLANQAYPGAPVNTTKARTEMTHRYFAETLGVLIILLAGFSYHQRKNLHLPRWLPPLLIGMVLAQGLLGMLTVTLRLLPLVVVSHLIGGLCTVVLIWLIWLYLYPQQMIFQASSAPFTFAVPTHLSILGMLTLGVLITQIILGGWTSANYAAIICPDFPTCHGQWLPLKNLSQAFNFLGGVGSTHPLNYMDATSRITIHMMHRLGALVTLGMGFMLIWQLIAYARRIRILPAKKYLLTFSTLLGFLFILQLTLGISNVLFSLPLTIAVAHHGVAVLLLLTLVTLNFTLCQSKRYV